MTPPEQNSSAEDMRKIFRAMQMRMRNYAFHHLDRIGPRTRVMLESMDLLEDKAEAIGAQTDVAVLRDSKHPRRVALPAGPLLLYVTEEEKPKGRVVELPVLLYSGLSDVRKAALACLEPMIADGTLDATPKTRKVFETSRKALGSDASSEWRPAAVAANDSLYDDILIAIQGTRQSLATEPVIQDSLSFFVPKVLYPTISSLDSIELAVKDPETQHSMLAATVQSVVAGSSTLGDACARYYAKIGYLPLAPSYALGEVVSRWLEAHPATDAWTEVWGWARAALGPVPQYHACSVFVLRPDLVPNGRFPDLWHEILGVVHETGKKGEENVALEPWALRRDLARHFLYHLEAHLPDNDGASIAAFAWWLAETVAALFSVEPGSAQFYRENWVKPSLERSEQVWLAASSHIGRSYLRYVTASIRSPWASSLLALMGPRLEQLLPADQVAETRVVFRDALVSNLISAIPFAVEPPADPTFALECSMSETALKWASCQPEDHQKALEQLVETSRTLGTIDGLCKALRNMGASSLPDQVAIALSLKAMAHTNPTVAESVWEILSDEAWRQAVLGTVEVRVLGLLMEAFITLEAANQGKWFSLLPHYIAEVCEKTENDERRHILFLYVVHACLASDTVSAVRRLLRGSQKAKFVECVRTYREQVDSLWTQYPPWVQGRLRGMLANLRVV